MSRSSNSLRTSDVITTPIKLKYTSSYDCSTLEQYGIAVSDGVNGPVTITGSIPQNTLNYWSARHLYYSNYLTGSFAVSASSADNYLQSTAASGTFDADVRYFPTQSGARITILSIPRNVAGERLSRKGFIMASSAYYLIDDGNGNVIDQAAANAHVGNIIYPQGTVVFTNSDYLDIIECPPPPTTTTTTSTTTTTTTVPTTTTTSTTTTTTTAPPTTTTTSTTTTTTTAPPTTTSTTTTTTTEPTTSTTTTTTTEPTTSTTTTTTTEPPTTTTSTTTTTTTQDLVAINLYADQEGVAYNLDFHISTDGGSTWNFAGVSFNNTTCPGSPTLSFNVVRNSSLMVRMGSTTNINTYYRSNRDTVTCPAFANGSAQCEWSILTNANRTFYHTTNVEDSSGCPDTTTTTTTSTTTTTTTAAPTTTTSTTTTTTTAAPTTTTSTTTTTTTEAPTTTTSTTTTTTTEPTTSTTTTTTTEPTTSTTTTTTTEPTTTTTTTTGTTSTTTTAPPTTTTTSTTTTTTTVPPLVITNGTVTCSGNTGNFTSTLSGGTGTYNFVAIDTTQANVANLIATGTSPSGLGSRVVPSGGTSHNWTGIANGTWYTAVQDSSSTNSVQNSGVAVSCTTTTTSTTTTTTTAATTTTTSTTTTTTTEEPTTTTSTTTTTTTVACFEYVATAGQSDIDNADGGTVYFEYVDCDGNPVTIGRGTTDPSNPICAQSVGTVYILVGGNQSAAGSSFWSGPGDQCNEPPPPPPPQ